MNCHPERSAIFAHSAKIAELKDPYLHRVTIAVEGNSHRDVEKALS